MLMKLKNKTETMTECFEMQQQYITLS